MQVSGYLVVYENQEEYDNDKRWHEEEGRDYERLAFDRYELMQPHLERFMPRKVREAIWRGEGDLLLTKLPEPGFMKLLEDWREEIRLDWQAAMDQYWSRYKAYEDKLPDCRKIIHRLHDAKVLALEWDRESGRIELRLDLSGSMAGDSQGLCRLLFSGVTECFVPEELTGNLWLYEELEYREGNIQLRVLLDAPGGYMMLNELSIRALGISCIIEGDSRAE